MAVVAPTDCQGFSVQLEGDPSTLAPTPCHRTRQKAKGKKCANSTALLTNATRSLLRWVLAKRGLWTGGTLVILGVSTRTSRTVMVCVFFLCVFAGTLCRIAVRLRAKLTIFCARFFVSQLVVCAWNEIYVESPGRAPPSPTPSPAAGYPSTQKPKRTRASGVGRRVVGRLWFWVVQ